MKATLVSIVFMIAPILSTLSQSYVELQSFTATPSGSAVMIEWNTTTEIDNDYFTIERSRDNDFWEPVLFGEGAGTTTTPQDYSLIDPSPGASTVYYRLKQTGFDGKTTTSVVISVEFEQHASQDLRLAPNPATYTTTLNVSSSFGQPAHMTIINEMGQPVMDQPVALRSGLTQLQINVAQLPAGLYFVRVESPTQQFPVSRLVVR